MNMNTIERPTISDREFARLRKREVVWYRRRVAAWDLAHKIGEVTEDSYEQAWDLLNSCKNLALGFTRCDELESEFNWRMIDKKRDKLIRRMERLNERLRPYGCHIDRQYCCENVYDWDFENNLPLSDKSYLYFF
jgi:hypothetical protein